MRNAATVGVSNRFGDDEGASARVLVTKIERVMVFWIFCAIFPTPWPSNSVDVKLLLFIKNLSCLVMV
jgi:hypothetical protein